MNANVVIVSLDRIISNSDKAKIFATPETRIACPVCQDERLRFDLKTATSDRFKDWPIHEDKTCHFMDITGECGHQWQLVCEHSGNGMIAYAAFHRISLLEHDLSSLKKSCEI
jgi:hypothetical protein